MKKPSPSVKNEMNQKDEFHISLDKLDIPDMDAHLHGRSLFNNPEKVGRKGTADQKIFGTNYCPESVTERPRTQELSCRLSLNEKFSNWGIHVSNDTFRGDLEFSGLLARKSSGGKNEVKIEASEKGC
jgi:hypothetical protein